MLTGLIPECQENNSEKGKGPEKVDLRTRLT